MKYLLGIDIGTSGCKAVLVNTEGRISAAAASAYQLKQPKPGWTEQAPEDWWQGVCVACAQLLSERMLPGDTLAGVGLSGQMHSLVVLDEKGEVVRPAILWNDQRTEVQCAEIEEAAGGRKQLLSFTNNRMLTGYTGGKLRWIMENEPDNFRRISRILITKDYIRYKLTGIQATDESDASGTGLFDVKKRCWNVELLNRLEIPPCIFPPVVSSTSKTGNVTKEASACCGIPAGTPVFAGAGDAVISLLGAGITSEERIGVTLGTSGVVAAELKEYIENPDGKLQMFCNATPGTWVAIGCTLAAAGSYQWFCSTLGGHEMLVQEQGGPDAFQLLDESAEKIPAGSGGMLFFPYLQGERCPLFEPQARAAFVGIDGTMTKGHFARAVLEGVAFSLRQVLELMDGACGKAREIIICGGGAKSALWRQIIADTFNLPVKTTYGSAEGSAYGAAVTAGIGCGIWESAEDAAKDNPICEITAPDPANREVYAKAYREYCNLYRNVTIKK